MLTNTSLEHILSRIPTLTLGVLGDLFLDRYLDIDASLTVPSLETGLDAYQVVRVRPNPGAVGTVINNLVALGVPRVITISVIGDDGEGYELRRALDALHVVDHFHVLTDATRRTPTYTKPMLCQAGQPPRELNRLDIKNHAVLTAAREDQVLKALADTWQLVDALLVVDQMDRSGYGVVTPRIIEKLAALGSAGPDKMILVDSRYRLDLFSSVWLKPNQSECLRTTRAQSPEAGAETLAQQMARPVFCTCGERGIYLVDPRGTSRAGILVPSYPVSGPIDIVGAGDSTSAAIACAVAAGNTLPEAAAFGNLVASVTIQQIGTTGTATPQQARHRWQEIQAKQSR
jgi:bifunctional ADP-heptose synthase (sugar kinase/adenylyltransferase)